MPTDPKKTLHTLLNSQTPGPVAEKARAAVEVLLTAVWSTIAGSANTRMASWKLGRIENLSWEPPNLSFQIERHGGTVQGSSRAEVQYWQVNIEKWTADLGKSGIRQLYPQAKPLDVGPLVDKIVPLILSHRVDSALKWYQDGRVEVLSGKLIPAEGVARETLAGRRRRFRLGLEAALKPNGWTRVGVTRLVFRKISE